TNATLSTLTLTNITTANVGNYIAVVSNAGGSVTSSVVTLTIPSPPTKSYVDLIKGDGPVSYWRLAELAGDVAKDAVDGNDGTYLYGVTLGVPGAASNDTNTAVRFSSAASQKVDVPCAEALNPTNFSAGVWARVTGGTVNYR